MSWLPFKRFKYLLNPRGTGDTEIDNAPDGWMDSNISYARSSKYSGLLRQFTLPMKFVAEGAFILRKEFYQYLLTSNVVLTIMQLMDGIINYKIIFTGRIDFSKCIDAITNFTVPVIPNDFTVNIDAYDNTVFAISLEDQDAINVELTPVILNEIANMLPQSPPDGNIHSDYFPPISIVNNTQNSLNNSVKDVQYRQFRSPDFSTDASWFFYCRSTGRLMITGAITFRVDVAGGSAHLLLFICNQNGDILLSIFDQTVSSGSNYAFNFNQALNVTVGDRLFLYMAQGDAETTNTGITIKSGEIDLSYPTSSPATMCKALRGDILFARLLQAMNMNNDSGPNLPVPYQSFLLQTELKDLCFTSSDSIRSSEGSIYRSEDGIYPGIYQVLSGSVNYNGNTYTVPETFPYAQGVESFTGTGVIQKIQSIAIGSVYNAGDDLQAGGTYEVQGATGQHAIYNGISYAIGTFFKYILGQSTFSGSDDTVFVIQTSEDPQIVISFADFFQSIYAIKGGQAAFGIENGTCFLEDLGYVYRKGINNLSLGLVDPSTKFEPAIDLLYNTIKVGYADQQYDAVNGSKEFNSVQNYTTFLFNPQKELNLICPVRADSYGIETIRITQNDSAASRSNNDTFAVWLKNTHEPPIDGNIYFEGFVYWHPLRTEGYTNISGSDESVYNWKLSPKQNLLRGGSFLASIFYNMKGYQISLASALKNSALVVIQNDGKRISEADPINISDLPSPFFQPIYATITPGLANDIMAYLDVNPYADMNFDSSGVNIKGFINKFSVQIGNDKPTETKLLLTPDNDLTKLIR